MVTQTKIDPRVLDVVKAMMVGPQRDFNSPEQFDRAMQITKGIYGAIDRPSKMKEGTIASDFFKSIGGVDRGNNPLVAAVQQMQQSLIKSGIDVGKEIDFDTFTDAIPTALNFNVFDLSGPARITAPFYAPLRDRIPRTSGLGPSALFKIITGFSGSQTGGVSNLNPAFNLEVPLAGANIEAARGNPVEYATADGITAYKFNAIRDAVTMTAFITGEGFQDLRAMSAAIGMQIGMMAEERAILMGRTSVLATVGAATGTERAVVAPEVGILGTGTGGTNVYVKVTAIGPFGETGAGTISVAVNIAEGTTSVIDYTWTDVTGALGYNVYVLLQDAGATDVTGSFYLDYIVGSQQSTGFNQFTVGTAGRRTIGSTVPASDTGTGSALNYRGLIQSIEEGPALGTTSIVGTSQRINAEQAGSNMTWLQNIFATMWQNAKADPEEVWMNSREIKNASDLILAGSTTNYRIQFEPSQANGIIAGTMVSSVINESTRRVVNLKTHPWLPFGNAVILSYALPFPTAFGQVNVMEMKGPQDYMQIQWPLTTLRYEWSLIWMNALALYAPTFCAIVHGIAQEDDAAAGFIC